MVESPISTAAGKRVHFPGLNTLRAYAAFSVLIVHTKQNFGEMRTQPANCKVLDLLVMDAQIGVDFFLVLSGFLITYLLLSETARMGSVDIPRFYARRILRIWPLYYLIVLLGLVILPVMLGPEYALSQFPLPKAVPVLLLLPNFVGSLGPLEHLWSIGLEQQFYWIWPWVIRKKERLVKVSVGILLVKLAVWPVVSTFQEGSIQALFLSLRFESLALGALGAYLYFNDHALLRYIRSPGGQALGIAGLVLLAVYDPPLTYPGHLISSLLLMIFILNTATNPGWGSRLDCKVFDTLGRISYGIYMYHYLVLYAAIFTLNRTGLPEGDLYSLLLYLITISLTVILSLLSYRWFESQFLRLKEKYAVIKTRQ